MTVTLSILAMLLATLIGILAPDTPAILAATSVCLLAGTILMVRRADSRRRGTIQTLCGLFFVLAVAHIVFGYLLAGLTTEHTSIRSNAQVFFAKAMLINSIGLFAGGLGYVWTLNGRSSSQIPGIPILINRNIAEKIFYLMALFGSVLMFFAYWKLGFVDFLSDPSKWPFMR